MRQQLVKFRTAQINGLRGLLTEYGEVMPKGQAGISQGIAAALEQVVERLPTIVVETLRKQWARVIQLDREFGEIESRLKLWRRSSAASQRVAEIPSGPAGRMRRAKGGIQNCNLPAPCTESVLASPEASI